MTRTHATPEQAERVGEWADRWRSVVNWYRDFDQHSPTPSGRAYAFWSAWLKREA